MKTDPEILLAKLTPAEPGAGLMARLRKAGPGRRRFVVLRRLVPPLAAAAALIAIFSLHFTQPPPGADADSAKRPLPSSEDKRLSTTLVRVDDFGVVLTREGTPARLLRAHWIDELKPETAVATPSAGKWRDRREIFMVALDVY